MEPKSNYKSCILRNIAIAFIVIFSFIRAHALDAEDIDSISFCPLVRADVFTPMSSYQSHILRRHIRNASTLNNREDIAKFVEMFNSQKNLPNPDGTNFNNMTTGIVFKRLRNGYPMLLPRYPGLKGDFILSEYIIIHRPFNVEIIWVGNGWRTMYFNNQILKVSAEMREFLIDLDDAYINEYKLETENKQ